ncbi:MAG: transketolase [Deltaproteobacteria bacterium]|nr:transketolase [Deltaproteobacteria bacterium]
MPQKYDIEYLKRQAKQLRVDVLMMLNISKSGHTGGSLSSADIVATLYFYKMRHNSKEPDWQERDRFVLSKGHAAPILYAALARCGYFEPKELKTLRRLGSILQGHPDMKSTPGVDVSTGSLGQGLSMANGIAMALRLDKSPSRVYALMGDGEVEEGQVWEAAMSSAHYKLDNLCAVVDFNGFQIDGAVTDIMNIEPLSNKWEAFGWHVLMIDGHDIIEIIKALDTAEGIKGKPTVIIARTIKGKGCSIFEGKYQYHGIPPSDEELKTAFKELGVSGQGWPEELIK